MLYILCKTYVPNTAPINRMLGWVKGLSELGVESEFVFFEPSDNYDRIQAIYPHIKFTYMWDKFLLKRKPFKYIAYIVYIFIALFMVKKNDKVLSLTGGDILHLFVKYSKAEVYSEESECPDVYMVKNRLRKTTVSGYLNDCKKLSGLFVISNNLREYFLGKGIDDNKIHIVNMTVDSTRFDNVSKHPGERYIAYCGNASNNKDGVDQLIKAFSITSKAYPDVKLYIIGPKPASGIKFPNNELVKNLGLSDKVFFSGMVSSSEMPQILKNASVLALNRPNNMQAKYGFPTKLGEYLLTGNPVVITRVGNIPLFLQDGVSAFIANPDQPEDFAAKLNQALESKNSYEIGERGRAVALKEFNYKIETKKIIDIILCDR